MPLVVTLTINRSCKYIHVHCNMNQIDGVCASVACNQCHSIHALYTSYVCPFDILYMYIGTRNDEACVSNAIVYTPFILLPETVCVPPPPPHAHTHTRCLLAIYTHIYKIICSDKQHIMPNDCELHFTT